MRGDNVYSFDCQVDGIGSPPHAWGQCRPRRAKRRRRPVHPHMRGDNVVMALRKTPTTGSPPHAWGQSINAGASGGGNRFTPTCVGTMARLWTLRCSSPVHPHMRGDNENG